MLGFSPLPRTLEAALRDVMHARPEVRLSAVLDLKRLARTGEGGALSCLARLLGQDPEPRLRAACALALADADANLHLADLVAAASDADGGVRQMALLAVGELAPPGDEVARVAARVALGDVLPAVRYQAIVALARLEAEGASESILTGTRDSDAEVRHVAFRVAEEVFAAGPVDVLPLSIAQRARAALRDDSPAVQLAAAILLAVRGEQLGAERVVAAVNARPAIKHIEDEVVAVELCGALGLRAATPGLERRAFGFLGSRGPVSWHARVALAELGHPRAKAVILRGLSAWSRDRRTLAVAAAGRAQLIEARELLVKMAGAPERAEPEAVADALSRIDGASVPRAREA